MSSSIGLHITRKNISSLHELNSLPSNIEISRDNDGNGLEETLITHSAKWHKACYVLCNATRKREENVSQELPHSPVHTGPTQHKHSLTFYENEIQTMSRLVFFL